MAHLLLGGKREIDRREFHLKAQKNHYAKSEKPMVEICQKRSNYFLQKPNVNKKTSEKEYSIFVQLFNFPFAYLNLFHNVVSKRVLIFSLLLMLVSVSAQAATYYIRSGASGIGNGSDWNNAFSSMPSSLIRGATYYIADGSYGSYTFDDVESGTTVTKVKKAIESDHGTDSGWTSSYGDGKAIFSNVIFNSSFWEFDGQTGGGPKIWNDKYGIVIYSTSSILISLGQNVKNIAILHVKATGSTDGDFNAAVKGVYTNSNLKFSYCEIGSVFGPIFHIGNWSNVVIEYCYLHDNKSTAEWHSEGISSIGNNDDIVIRYCIWDKIAGTAVIAGVNYGSSNNWEIYGNVFSRSVSTIYYYWEVPGTNQNSMTNSMFFNNIVVGMRNGSVGGLRVQNGNNNIGYNNVWYDNVANSFGMSFAMDYTYADENIRIEDCSPVCDKNLDVIDGDVNGWLENGNPFTYYNEDPLLSDFTPKKGFYDNHPGYDTKLLIGSNNIDMNGNKRGIDGIWDRGAIEYIEDTITPITIASPSNPHLTIKITPIEVTASSNDGNIPENTIDNNMGTRWSAEGDGQWIQYDLGLNKTLSHVKIAWYQGILQIADFSILTSTDANNWTEQFNGQSQGTDQLELYNLNSTTTARFVRIVGYGSSINSWNSINEVEIHGVLN